jgi:hypothetical protein
VTRMSDVGRFGTRSGLLALVVAALLCATALVHPLGAVHADLFFCEDDPIVNINGVNVSITVGVASDGLSHVRGRVPILIVTPDAVPAHLVSSSDHFLHEQIYIVHAGDALRTIRSVLHGDDQDEALAAVAAAHNAGRVLVLSEVFTGGEHDYRTRLYSGQSPVKANEVSNHLMQLSFALPQARVTTSGGTGTS